MALVELLQQVELLSLLTVAHRVIANVLDEPIQLGVPHVNVSALIGSRQKGGLPVLRFLNRVAPWTHGDEAGQILVLATKTVGDPGTQTRANLQGLAAVH